MLRFDNLQSLYEFYGWSSGSNGLFFEKVMECQWNEKSKTKDKMIKTNNTKTERQAREGNEKGAL